LPEWQGHAPRRALGNNLYWLGVPDAVIQRILRHANVSTTTGTIKAATADVQNAMTKLEYSIPERPFTGYGDPAPTTGYPEVIRSLKTGLHVSVGSAHAVQSPIRGKRNEFVR
jgi:hypothetical protein